jgi:hypothetical protein
MRRLAVRLDLGTCLSSGAPRLAVNGDLPSGQVLRGSRQPLADSGPVLLRGDIYYDPGYRGPGSMSCPAAPPG